MRIVFVILSILLIRFSYSQEDKKYVREGNKKYEEKKYSEAEHSYAKALDKKKDNYKATLNMGDAYYKQGKYKEAADQFEIATTKKMSKDSLAGAHHNLGNALLKSKKYDESINAYKKALKNKPDDQD